MKYTLSNISHFDFFNGLEMRHNEILNELNLERINSLEIEQKSSKLIEETETFISTHILPNSEEILSFLEKSYYRYHDFDYSKYNLDFQETNKTKKEIEKETYRLRSFKNSLKLLINYLSMVDSLADSSIELNVNTILEKNDFILLKLNSVFGDEEYSIEKIFELNGIKYRNDETKEIADDLFKRGYLSTNRGYITNDQVKISVKGARYIERKLSQQKNNIKNGVLDKKIDIIIEQLTKLGFGQEIIFNEIDELRGLQNKLSKKSWSQLLKGKLVDLALDKLITVEIAKTVYEYLTSNDFKLLK